MPRNDLVFVRVVSAEIEKMGGSLLVYAPFLRVFYGQGREKTGKEFLCCDGFLLRDFDTLHQEK